MQRGNLMTVSIATPLTEALGCRYPIISAGMGGPARSELAAAVSAAGGFGLLGMVRESPDLIAREIIAVKRRTNRPFGVNLIPFATNPQLLAEELAAPAEAVLPVELLLVLPLLHAARAPTASATAPIATAFLENQGRCALTPGSSFLNRSRFF